MNTIATKQNQTGFIDRLAAQRHLYSQAKHLSVTMFILCVVFPVLIAVLNWLLPENTLLSELLVIYSVCATMLQFLLKDMLDSRRQNAAAIQQLFDCELFNLSWNTPLCDKQPLPEVVHKYMQGVPRDKLDNWYEPEVSNLSHNNGALVCMRTNVVYDKTLRQSYFWFCVISIILIAIAIISLGMVNNTGLFDFFLYAVVPLMPLVTWIIDFIKQYQTNIKALDKVETLIQSALLNAKDGDNVSIVELEEIQNYIYIHRKSSYLIPDLFYKIRRNKQEQAAKYGVAQIIMNYNLN